MSDKLRPLRWAVLGFFAFLLNFPVIATLATSFKTPRELVSNAGLFVREPTLTNYGAVLQVSDRLNIYEYLTNSLIIAAIGAILPLILCFPMAYTMARRGYGRAVLLPVVINLRTLPLIIFAIPIYMMYQTLGLLDTRLGLGLILAIVNIPLTLIILVNAVDDIPIQLEEAADIDGARLTDVLFRVVLPLCRPALATTFIFGFITAWNEFLFGLMLTTQHAVPVTVGASFFFAAGGGGVQWGVAAAVIIVASLPPVVLGTVMYRQITRSLLAGAVKG
ncbi:carbohydrate ABC transporter permease [Bauldia sp.]|uniref:carbohydrate ABC transporter permease n=1 Tax=Bauldia sp. TaxID=2575872 RepID=UPI003BABEC80